MPTYEYLCTACANEWEAEQSIRDAALKDCPKCKKSTARRQISRGTGFILKGGGWYSDLYSSKGSSSKGTEATDGGSSKPASETKTDASPKPTTETKSDTPKGSSTAAA